MIKQILFFLVLAIPFLGYTQPITLVSPISSMVNETSGLIYLDNRLITHNDSGGNPILYEIDTLTGNVTRQVTLSNATNVDWEDICHDDSYIYVADFGNNSGARMNLKIYRILIADYLANNSVTADIINFDYSDQTDFTPSSFTTNFDAETLISYKDSLYIFTKNWGNYRTNIYPLSKQPGTYSISKTDSIDTQGLVTGGDYDSTTNEIILCGYTPAEPFFVTVNNITNSTFSSGIVNRKTFVQVGGYSFKIEGITHVRPKEYLFSAEDSPIGPRGLFRWDNTLVSIEEYGETASYPSLYPNPANHTVMVSGDGIEAVEIYNLEGRLQKKSKKNQIDTSTLLSGVYVVLIKTEHKWYSKKLIISPW